MEISWRSPPPAYSRREDGEDGLVTIVLRCPRPSSSSTNLCLAVYLCVTVRNVEEELIVIEAKRGLERTTDDNDDNLHAESKHVLELGY